MNWKKRKKERKKARDRERKIGIPKQSFEESDNSCATWHNGGPNDWLNLSVDESGKRSTKDKRGNRGKGNKRNFQIKSSFAKEV